VEPCDFARPGLARGDRRSTLVMKGSPVRVRASASLEERSERHAAESRPERAERAAPEFDLLVPERVLDLQAPDPAARGSLELLIPGLLIQQDERESVRGGQRAQLAWRCLRRNQVPALDCALEPCVCRALACHRRDAAGASAQTSLIQGPGRTFSGPGERKRPGRRRGKGPFVRLAAVRTSRPRRPLANDLTASSVLHLPRFHIDGGRRLATSPSDFSGEDPRRSRRPHTRGRVGHIVASD
jgi:hypothetical protein